MKKMPKFTYEQLFEKRWIIMSNGKIIAHTYTEQMAQRVCDGLRLDWVERKKMEDFKV